MHHNRAQTALPHPRTSANAWACGEHAWLLVVRGNLAKERAGRKNEGGGVARGKTLPGLLSKLQHTLARRRGELVLAPLSAAGVCWGEGSTSMARVVQAANPQSSRPG